MAAGWIKLHRKTMGWEWYTDVPVFKLFVHLLLLANHEEKKWKGVTIKRGQVLCSRAKLARDTGLTEQQIRTAITKLKSTQEITSIATKDIKTGSHLISIVKWEKYNPVNQEDNQESNFLSTKHQPSINQASTTTKNIENIKNDKNEEEVIEGFRAEILEEDAFITMIRHNWRLNLDQVNSMLDAFELQLVSENKKHKDIAGYKGHFHNWGVKRYTDYWEAETKSKMVF